VPVIELCGLRREFPARGRSTTVAVDGLDLSVPRGSLVGLLGPNGAGKTTTVKILMTVLLPTSGTAKVLGRDVVREAQFVRRNIGVVLGGDSGLYLRLSGRDNLALFADLYGIPFRQQRRRIFELLDLVGLTEHANKRAELYSRGMRQRLHIARGLLHDPAVVIMDEPTSGIDPVGAMELRALVQRQVDEGRTILLTTHYMFEAEELCDRVVVLDKGHKVAEGPPRELARRTSGSTVLTVAAVGVTPDDMARLKGSVGIRAVNVEERDGRHLLTVYAEEPEAAQAAVVRLLPDQLVGEVVTRRATLEDAYVSLVSGSR
jgi:ABC-2 type transport system ATP-binding protein